MLVVVALALVVLFAWKRGGLAPGEILDEEGFSTGEVTASGSRGSDAKASSPQARAERRKNIAAAPGGKSVYTGLVYAADGGSLDTTVTVALNASVTTASAVTLDLTTTTLVGHGGGEYRFEVDPVDSAMVNAGGAGFISMAADTSPEGEEAPLRGTPRVVVRDFAMQRGAEVSGRLVDTTGAPLSGIVTAVWEYERLATKEDVASGFPVNDSTTEAGPGGEFRLKTSATEVTLMAASPGYGALMKKVTAPARGVEFRFGDGALVEGRVLQVGSNDLVSSATVFMNGETIGVPDNRLFDRTKASAVTDRLGNFMFRGVPKGSFSLSASGEKLFPMPGPKGNLELNLSDGLSTSGHTLFVYPGHTVRGQVTEKMTGAPMPDVRLKQWWDKNKPTLTDSNGRFTITGVVRNELIVYKEGFRLSDVVSETPGDIRPRSSEGENLWLQLGEETEITRDFEMVESLTVSGRVSLKNGDSVPDATVSLESYGYTRQSPNPKKTQPDGTFRFDVEPNTNLNVKATAEGYANAWSDLVNIADDSVTGVVILMETGGTLAGVVVDPAGKPVLGADVGASVPPEEGKAPEGNRFWETKSDADGKFVFFNLPSGEIVLNAAHAQFANCELKRVVVENGKTRSDIRLQLRKSHFIEGRVMDQNKKPVPEATVSFFNNDRSSGVYLRNTKSDEKGKYRVEGLKEGLYMGQCRVPDVASARLENVEVDRKGVDFVLNIPKLDFITVVGKVTDWKTLKPISQFEVRALGFAKQSPDKPGEFQLQMRPNESNTVTVLAEGCLPYTQQMTASEWPGGVPPEYNFPMGPGGTIIGRVLNRSDKTPLAGVKVAVGSEGAMQGFVMPQLGVKVLNTITTEKGEFVFQKTPPGVKVVEAKIEGKAPCRERLRVSHDQVHDMGDMLTGTGGTVRVQVVRDPGGEPVEGTSIQITLSPDISSIADGNIITFDSQTNGEGLALFGNIPSGSYYVREQSAKLYGSCAVKEGEVTEFVMTLGTGTLSGLLTFQGKPLPQCQISLSTKGEGAEENIHFIAQTNGEGRYTINDLPAGSYQVDASYHMRDAGPGQASFLTVTTDIKGGDEQKLDISMPSGRIAGRVIDADGNPVENTYVTSAYNEAPNEPHFNRIGRTAESDKTGAFNLHGLEGGSYTLYVDGFPDRESETETVIVPPDGEAPPITLQLLPVEE
jgi:protocatechuate 3,4-dioxygenase beta subunit